MTAEDKEEFGEDKPEKKGAAASAMVVSGAKATEDQVRPFLESENNFMIFLPDHTFQAYPKEAVKSFHEKPIPSHVNKMPGHSTKPNIIQQPKK